MVPPANVVRHDDDDPYLVVAADKGTATFSDIANAIAQEHDFWLDDAFASGGSAGYDHKKMGITARGAWESVKRHFREMDVDIGATPFTVVGIGDMSGDVFGNGMLRERTIKLVAAFDHRDIFIDPAPDPGKSFEERRRLFDLPRSSWQDYDRALISQGGGVFSRALKEIALSDEARAVLDLGAAKVTPQEVIRAILKAPVDLIFFGGIGTYVRASAETDDAVGDRANDAIRITGADIRAKVIGEGANLGMTQRGRVEAALRGIRLNTDAIDNSAGVNTSDVEVNLKIALARPMRDGRLARAARNALLADMTDDVAALVLRNNYLQPLAISLAERRGLEDLGFEQRLMQTLETAGELDRTVEFLPDEMEIAERRRRSQALTRPELAVLLAYAKLALHHELLQSNVPDDPYLGRELGRYFPKAVTEQFPDAVEHHRLRREIIATQLANSMINRGGPSLLVRIADQTGASAASIAAAFAAVRDSYGMSALNGEIDALDNRISGKLQLALYQAVQDLLLDRLVWFLRNVDLTQGLAAIVAHYRDGIAAVESALDDVLAGAGRRCAQGAGGRVEQGWRAARACASPRHAAGARGGAGYRDGCRPRRAEYRRGCGDLFRGRGVLPSRSDRQRRARHRDLGLFRPARARPRTRLDRRCRTAAYRRHGRQRDGRSQGGGGLGRAAQGRGRPHPHVGSRDRQFRADALEAVGGGEPAGGSGEELTCAANAGSAACPVNTMAMPWSSAALITSSSRIEPPGWITAVAPASIATRRPSANGKNASDATTEPLVSGSLAPAACAASSALRAAMRAESMRLIWPAPMPTVARSLA